MNEQLQKFIEWLPQNVEEFKDKSADEIAQILNQLSQSDEGKQQLNQLMEQFNSSVAQFRAGGKFRSFIKKFQPGGKAVRVVSYAKDAPYNEINVSEDPYHPQHGDGRNRGTSHSITNYDWGFGASRYADDRDTVWVRPGVGTVISRGGKRAYYGDRDKETARKLVYLPEYVDEIIDSQDPDAYAAGYPAAFNIKNSVAYQFIQDLDRRLPNRGSLNLHPFMSANGSPNQEPLVHPSAGFYGDGQPKNWEYYYRNSSKK